MGKPTIINVEALIAAGIDPKTGLPLKISDANMKCEIKKNIRILDEQEFCNRYVWKNIPANISSQELERMLYYKGQLIMFFAKDVGDGEFFITPYSLDGGIDFYGRYRTVKPVPMSSGTDENDAKQKSASDAALALALPIRFRVPAIGEMPLVGTRRIVYSDLDYNGHMNNTHYPDMLCDFTEGITSREVTGFSLSYLQEAAYGRNLSVYRSDLGEEHFFRTVDEEGNTCLEAKLFTKPIEDLR